MTDNGKSRGKNVRRLTLFCRAARMRVDAKKRKFFEKKIDALCKVLYTISNGMRNLC